MKTYEFKDLKDYLDVVETIDQGTLRLFRGQPCNKPLLPKIARKNPRKDTANLERVMLSELRRRGTLFLGKDITNDWDLLVYAQHFGMFTRLLDWTSNPLAALWFSCSDRKPDAAGYVYVFEVTDNLLLNINKSKDPFSIAVTRVFKPNLNNNRIVAQGGWFTAHRFSKNNGRYVSLEHNAKFADLLLQIKVPGKEKEGILKKLDILGVNSQSLFPDIEGLCQHVNWVHDA